jgi:hypothetical protein
VADGADGASSLDHLQGTLRQRSKLADGGDQTRRAQAGVIVSLSLVYLLRLLRLLIAIVEGERASLLEQEGALPTLFVQ